MQTGREELLESIAVAEILAIENPCGLGDGPLRALAQGIRALVSQQYTKSMTQEAAAKYLGVTTRTLQRYAEAYYDFPKGRHEGHKELSYDPVKLIEWKKRHREVGS